MEKLILSIKSLKDFIQDWFEKLTSKQKQQLAIVCTVVFAAILIFSVLISLGRPAVEETPAAAAGRMTIFSPVPAEELFLPDEPDFIPGVLLEREQRTNWTTEDAAEHWQDPLIFGEENWREKIETAIDEFLERVP